MQAQRLDKWLWFARIVKSRTLAAKLVTSGKIRVNEEKVTKPAATVSPDDVITAIVHKQLKVLKVLAPGERRGPAADARRLFLDLSPPMPKNSVSPRTAKDGTLQPVTVAVRERGSGRPTKRERRQTDALRPRDMP